MSNITAINLSPRQQGTSRTLLMKCKELLESRGDQMTLVHLYSHQEKKEALFDAISAADTLVLCGPCYVNTYPADTTRLLEELAARPGVLRGKNLYGIIQGGMPYAHTHASGLAMLKVFAKRVNATYQGGFVMGLGAMLDGQPLHKLPNGKKVERQLAIFCQHIHNGEKSPDSVYEAALLKIPGLVTRILVVSMNRKIDKTFSMRGMDAHAPSPYLDDPIE